MNQSRLRRLGRFAAGVSVCLIALDAAATAGQEGSRAAVQTRRAGAAGQAGSGSGAGQYSVAEVQQMFDALTLMQAEQSLNLTEMQFPEFLSKLRVLQQQRRRFQQERRQLIQQLVRLTGPSANAPDETQLKDRLKALADLDQRAGTDLRAAYEAIDQVLSVEQQARFRILEEQVERRKFDLLARARRGAPAEAPTPPKAIK